MKAMPLGDLNGNEHTGSFQSIYLGSHCSSYVRQVMCTNKNQKNLQALSASDTAAEANNVLHVS